MYIKSIIYNVRFELIELFSYYDYVKFNQT